MHAINDSNVAIREMEYATADDVGVSPLGSGSDYTVFLQRAGVSIFYLIDGMLIDDLLDTQY